MNEINDLFIDFDEMGFCPTTLVKNPEAYAIQWRINMREAIIKHEQDTLKEFVEWLKARFVERTEKQGKTYDEFYEDGFSEQDCEFQRGKYTGFSYAIDWLDQDLEQFIKEKSDENNR